jgi:hypothetical protein
MGPAPSSLLGSVPKQSLLACLLKCWKDLDPNNLKEKKTLIFFCTEAWPLYPLSDQENWPSEGSLNYNTIIQLDLLCKREEKWTEIPYVLSFISRITQNGSKIAI